MVVVLVEGGSCEILVSTFSGVSKRRPSSEVDDGRAPIKFFKWKCVVFVKKHFWKLKNIVIQVSASVCSY